MKQDNLFSLDVDEDGIVLLPTPVKTIKLWQKTVSLQKIGPECRPNDGKHRYDINPGDRSAIKKRLSILDFPCYENQAAIDTFAIYARVSNQRGFFVPCIDCNACFQEKSSNEGKCRYPAASFMKDHEDEFTLKSLGMPVYLSRYDQGKITAFRKKSLFEEPSVDTVSPLQLKIKL